MANFCSNCGKRINEDDTFCANCGFQLESEEDNDEDDDDKKICKFCKSKINADAKVCPICRKQLSMSWAEWVLGIILGIILFDIIYTFFVR